jgi:membrane-associated PAP2 superfamily phosphatase
MMLIPLGIATLKQLISRHCPWDMVDFGGFAPYLHLLDTPPTTIKAGVCFPAGHASAGFLWIVWGVALRPAGRGPARLGLVAGLLLGGVLGVARMAQGAHFLSHTLWSLWFAWALSLGLALVLGADLKLGTGRKRVA